MAEDFTMVAEAMFAAYAESVNAADADGLAALFWLEDERFSAIEDSSAAPFGRATFEELLAQRYAHGRPGDHLRWRDLRAYRLGDAVGYVTALQDCGETQSRVTLILVKKGWEWGILHEHVSGRKR